MLETPNSGTKVWNIEWKLALFAFYIILLVSSLLTGNDLKTVATGHLSFVILFSIVYFGRDFLYILFSPVMAFAVPITYLRIKRYLKKFKKNTPEEVVLVMGHSDWTKLEAWLKPNAFLAEMKSIVKYLQTKNQNFSFYTHATLKDVEEIMSNKTIKEVYFVGHGSSHLFQLKTDVILYYCEFNNLVYGKEFVHQIHCGTSHGKSLADYVVPEQNRKGCFFFRKPITGPFIEKQFENKIKELSK